MKVSLQLYYLVVKFLLSHAVSVSSTEKCTCIFMYKEVLSGFNCNHGGAKPPPKWVMKCPVFWLIFNNFVTFHHFFTKLGNLIWVFVPNNLT